MTDWQNFWNSHPAQIPIGDHLRQVGKTVNGISITSSQVEALVADIRSHLSIREEHRVLDLCCGNGVITYRCAAHCRAIVGVDYSTPLIAVARTQFNRENISYIIGDVRNLPADVISDGFDRIYMYEALQHLQAEDVRKMLLGLRQSSARTAPLLLGSVPDKERLWEYYNTPSRREEYLRRKEAGTEAIGCWWAKSSLSAIADACGYSTEFRQQNPVLHTAHYRFDALLRPTPTTPSL